MNKNKLMSKEEQYYLDLENQLLMTKSKGMMITMYIGLLKKLDKINEICEDSEILYTCDTDYDYYENPVFDYTPSDILENIRKIIKE